MTFLKELVYYQAICIYREYIYLETDLRTNISSQYRAFV